MTATPAARSTVPLEICASRLYGIPSVMKVKHRGKLTTIPVWTIVVLTPFATPRLVAEMGPIIELALGEMKNPLPIPEAIRARVIAT